MTALTACGLLLSLSAAGSSTLPLQQAIEAYQRLDDQQAVAAFHAILAGNPPSQVAAKAHLYLGLIAFNAIQPDQARAEFEKAIEANPALDMPTDASPKAMLAFAEARRNVTRRLAQEEVLRPPPSPAAQPGPLPVAPRPAEAASPALTNPWPSASVERAEAPPAHSHVPALVLAGAALACAVVAIVGGVQVIDYNSSVTQANQRSGTVSGFSLKSAQGSASFWQVGWIAFAAVGAGALTTSVIVW